jgi:hypothetical protein
VNILFSDVIGIDHGSSFVKVAVVSKDRSLHMARTAEGHIFIATKFGHDFYLQRPALSVPGIIFNEDADYTFPGYEITSRSLDTLISSVKTTENLTDLIEVVIAVPPTLTAREKSYLYTTASLAYASAELSGVHCASPDDPVLLVRLCVDQSNRLPL